MTRTIVLTGARGGQGTSTVAAALAVLAAGHGPVVLRSGDPSATTALLGLGASHDEWTNVCPRLSCGPLEQPTPAETGGAEVEVIDGGRTPARPWDDPDDALTLAQRAATGGTVERYAVLRGPCYVALSTLVNRGGRYDGIILLTEPGRALSERDVIDVLGLPVVASIPVDPAVARSIDAGLLLSRLHQHTAPFRALSRLAQPRRESDHDPMQIDTELPLSRSDRSETKAACRARPSRGAVCRAWNAHTGRSGRVEHREALTGRCRLLRR